jgi:NADH:ubiquinone oxidoreductase subunit F (NADH-binding)
MSAQLPVMSETAAYPWSRGPAGLPRLLEGMPSQGAMSLAEHLVVHGPLGLTHRRSSRAEHSLIELIELAGLRGHGGAGFPTAVKMRAVASSKRRPVVVVNASEGEPASFKDRTLIRIVPHLVLDGATFAARALGSNEIIVGVCESARASVQSITDAIAERGAPGRGSPRTRLMIVPAHYLAGQESALVNHLGGGPAIPTFTPPMPFQQGVARRPTLVSNAETFAHVALIARHGPDWFRELGVSSQPGSTLVTLSGPVAYPGVYEIQYGASLVSLIHAAGGSVARARALLLGGYGGSWVGEEHLRDLVLSDEHLAVHGASLGAGVVLLLPEDACPVAETMRMSGWLAGQSAGQCGPCVHGLRALSTSLQEIVSGVADSQATQRIERLAALVRGRGACGHPDGAVKLILSALEAFGPEFADHARHGPCAGCLSPGKLPLPTTCPASPRATFKPLRPGRSSMEDFRTQRSAKL